MASGYLFFPLQNLFDVLFPFSNGQLQADIARGACRPAVLESRALSYCGHDYTGDTVTVPVSILSAREQVPRTRG